jgi:flagellar motor protein MotB
VDKEKWDKDEYLIPTYDNDNLLCLLEDILELNEDDFTTLVRNGNAESVADGILGRHETIMEDNEDGEKEADDEPPINHRESEEEENEQKEEKEEGEQSQQKENPEANAKVGMVVIPEDLPDLEDSALNDPELREQLK